ncbi:hypothetical protein OAE25_00405 [Verrucomicrobiales bacterium]|nr:hypothetical protein [Schleiferiaceae bacterium]MDB4617106.1 hypothetical protein [Verrucomicrobiales bacterium]|tara:strand:- start:15 stop:413 length:399 start_codon:yes stop_codon:yes gene_type:complete
MSILEIYKNPPNDGRQIRFQDGNVPSAENSYTPYQRNDQSSLRNSDLHYEAVELPGYSTDGTPKVNLYNSQYYAVGERPSDLSMNQGKVITTPDFTQPYTPNNPYQYEAMSNDLSGLDSLTNTSSTLQKLER